ncbi:TRAP transporter large permease subunit, partial [Roseovarius sp.]|uniref:TRAP transporter large permease subunit n=1 Tax=Roseovarius sp. TaxID=1486281 RepID=UPI00258034A7
MSIRKLATHAAAAGALALAAVQFASPATAQNVTIVVPFSAGGGTDITTRSMQEEMAKSLGSNVVVKNTSGAGGTIGVVIPPSVPMILYAVIAQESVAKLFISGILPGLAMGGGLVAIALYQGYARSYPKGAPLSLRTIGRSFVSAFWGLMTPVLILGGIFSGLFT